MRRLVRPLLGGSFSDDVSFRLLVSIVFSNIPDVLCKVLRSAAMDVIRRLIASGDESHRRHAGESFKIRSSGWMYQQSLTLRNVPGYSCLKPFLDLMCRRISESPLGLADVRQAVTHVA